MSAVRIDGGQPVENEHQLAAYPRGTEDGVPYLAVVCQCGTEVAGLDEHRYTTDEGTRP